MNRRDVSSEMNRRDVLRVGAAAALSLTTGAALNPRAYASGISKPRRVGLIGCGWFGKHDLTRLIQIEPVDVVSLCDVDQKMMQKAGELIQPRHASKKMPRLYGDYRKMLAEKDLDIVLVATPDHWHALAMIAAVEAGADVYVQKPTSVDVLEGKAMVDAARKHNRVVQVGVQRRSKHHLIDAIDQVIREGLLGDVGHVEICCYYHMRRRGNPPVTTPPEWFDYEMWAGPAPKLPYTSMIHPQSWRAFMEYGNGIIGDMGVHMFDIVRWMLNLGWPRRVSSSGGILVQTDSAANTPDTQNATFEYDNMNVLWTHRSWGDPPDPRYPWAAKIFGEKGTLKLDVQKWEFEPRGNGKKLSGKCLYEFDKYPRDVTDKKDMRLDQSAASALRNHMRDFLRAIDNRTKPVADIEQGHISSASCILANNALKLGRTLEFDPKTHTVVGDDEANKLLMRTYRAPWKHPHSEA